MGWNGTFICNRFVVFLMWCAHTLHDLFLCQYSVAWIIAVDVHFWTSTLLTEEEPACLSSAGSKASPGSPLGSSLETCSLLASALLTWSISHPWLALISSAHSPPWSLQWNCSVFSMRISPEILYESLCYILQKPQVSRLYHALVCFPFKHLAPSDITPCFHRGHEGYIHFSPFSWCRRL